ncbi:flavin reductase family protein [SAR202 cluster bacterium AD-804-J14_MRT_500m]|nr:flavin reductase family protein [SAR202 cluster bacterium AD-804-J14_MRT_500m]
MKKMPFLVGPRGGWKMNFPDVSPIMGRLWSPIAAVTSSWNGQDNIQIAVSISAASIVPQKPRVLVQIYKSNFSHALIYKSGNFALNFPRKDQLYFIKDFGLSSGRDFDKLIDVDYSHRSSGSPVLADSWGFLDCRVVNAMDGGDMTCFLADVIEGSVLCEGDPMWWRDARSQIPMEWNEKWNLKIGKEIQNSENRMGKIDFTPWVDVPCSSYRDL